MVELLVETHDGEWGPLITSDESGGARLREAMEREGWTVARLSDESGVSERTISALRNGSSAGSFVTWRLIARAMGLGLMEVCDA